MISESLEPSTVSDATRRPQYGIEVWHVVSISSGVRCCNQKSNRVWMA